MSSSESNFTYEPKPIDVTGVPVPEEMRPVVDNLARHLHDLWVLDRLRGGWTCPLDGKGDPDDRRMVPYDQLSAEDASAVGRQAENLIRAILAQGVRLERAGAADDSEDEAITTSGAAAINSDTPIDPSLSGLRAHWESLPPERRTPGICRDLGERILRMGEPLMAYDILTWGVEQWPTDVRLRQLVALSLSRSGASHRANEYLQELYNDGHNDGETLGLLARTHKDLADHATSEQDRRRHLDAALAYYEQGYRFAAANERSDEAYYTGINAATVAMLCGDQEKAHSIARHVWQICRECLDDPNRDAGGRYWIYATLGEAALILKEWDEARRYYTAASEAGAGQFANLNSTRKQAQRILKHFGKDPAMLDQLFPVPSVTVFTGHMIDQPDRSTPRFPAEDEQRVADAIAVRLDELNSGFGYASAACGSDILFLEAMLNRGGELHIVLPCSPEEFRKDSIDFAPDGNWARRFDHVIERAASVRVIGGKSALVNPLAYEYANWVTLGLARLRAGLLGADLNALAVWNGKEGDGPGGADSAIRFWRSSGLEPNVIHLAQPGGPLGAESNLDLPAPASERLSLPYESGSAEIVCMLFGDAVGFSGLNEAQLPLFISHYIGAVARLVDELPYKPVVTNTWGDGLFMVFESAQDAGHFALALADRIRDTDWTEFGLPATLNIRVALHAGPAIAMKDPLTVRPNYLGSHVSQAARIEPVTPPGRVYTSRSFAALVAADPSTTLACDYVGLTPLAKGYGTFPTYHLHRASE